MGTVEEPLSELGFERLIPIRVVQAMDCSACTNSNCANCTANITHQTLMRAIDVANETFQAAGIQFALRALQRYHLPSFFDLRPPEGQDGGCPGGGNTLRQWSTVRSQLQAVFPSTPADAWDDPTPKTPRTWTRDTAPARSAT